MISEIQKIVIENAVVSYKLNTGKGVERLGFELYSYPGRCGMIDNITEDQTGHDQLYFHSPNGKIDTDSLNWEHSHYIHGRTDGLGLLLTCTF